MTELQLRILDFIRRRIEATGLAPIYDEIAAEMGTKSRGAAHSLVQTLIRDGLLEKTAAGARNLRLPGVPDLVAVPTPALEAELERRDA